MQRITFNYTPDVVDNSPFVYYVSIVQAGITNIIHKGTILKYKSNIEVDITNVIYNALVVKPDTWCQNTVMYNNVATSKFSSQPTTIGLSNFEYNVYYANTDGSNNYIVSNVNINYNTFIEAMYIPNSYIEDSNNLKCLNIPLGSSISQYTPAPIYVANGANSYTCQIAGLGTTIINGSGDSSSNIGCINIYTSNIVYWNTVGSDVNYRTLNLTCNYRFYIYYLNSIGGIDIIGCNGIKSYSGVTEMYNRFPNYTYDITRDSYANNTYPIYSYDLTTEPIRTVSNNDIENLLNSKLMWIVDCEDKQVQQRYFNTDYSKPYGIPVKMITNSIRKEYGRTGIIKYNFTVDTAINPIINY